MLYLAIKFGKIVFGSAGRRFSRFPQFLWHLGLTVALSVFSNFLAIFMYQVNLNSPCLLTIIVFAAQPPPEPPLFSTFAELAYLVKSGQCRLVDLPAGSTTQSRLSLSPSRSRSLFSRRRIVLEHHRSVSEREDGSTSRGFGSGGRATHLAALDRSCLPSNGQLSSISLPPLAPWTPRSHHLWKAPVLA